MDVVAELDRSGLVESRHRGLVVRLDPDGRVGWAVGDPDAVIFPRSANKPIQALALLAAGLPLDGPGLALATASHSGEALHLAGVREVLAGAGLDESFLQTPPSYPLEGAAHAAYLRAGGTRAPICMDCSGKHAAMLATCVARGWSTDDYLDPRHPVQRQVLATFVELTGADPAVVSVDGCGAPLLATTPARLARAYQRIVTGEVERPDLARRLVTAAVTYPELVSGTRRTERRWMHAFGGALVKSGAEAVLVVAMPDATTFVTKIEDGSERPLYAVTARAMQLSGLDHPVLDERPEVLGGGRPVGRLRVTF